MHPNPSQKYRPFGQIDLPNRQWPSRTIEKAPRWLSTDFRDGNQAVIDPMDAHVNQRFIDLLVNTGVKETEVGCPAAGAPDSDVISGLAKSGKRPEVATVQVRTRTRRDLLETTVASLEGAK